MSDKRVYGLGDESNFMPATAISGTTPIVSAIIPMAAHDSVGLQLITTGTVAGAWKVEVSSNYVGTTNGSQYGAITASGDWTTIPNSEFSPAITDPAGSATSQYVQADLTCRNARITFTPASGAGNAQVIGFCKSWS